MSNAATWVPFLCATVVFYGLAQALTKQFMANLSTAAFIYLYLGVKIVINFVAFALWGHVPLISAAAARFTGLSIVGNLINGFAWLFYFRALESGPVSLVGSLTAGYPAVTVVLAFIFLGEHLRLQQYLGVALVIGSGMLIGMQGGGESSEAGVKRRWLVYSWLVVLGWGVFSTFIKAAFDAPGANTYSFFVWNAVAATAVLLPFARRMSRHEKLGPRRDLLLGLIPTALFALGDIALFRAFETGVASLVTPLSTIYPAVTLLYAVPVLKEKMTPAQWGALALLLAGIVIVSIA
ncbi:MAG: EamA family transporter [Cyanobacteria bacterium REEB65]|nr:EamA family transporter [Cyanobacteria bacterium REEB65]